MLLSLPQSYSHPHPHTLKSHYNTSNWSLWCSGEHMLIEPIESLEKHTVGWGPARTAAEENMWGPGLPARNCHCDETCKHVNTDAHYNTHLTRKMTFFCCANLTLGCVVASRFLRHSSTHPPFPGTWLSSDIQTQVHTCCLTSGPVVRCSLTGLDPQRRE